MVPVEQTILAPPKGDCFRACIASILELPIEEVPNPAPEDHWWKAWHGWLLPLGLQLVEWSPAKDEPTCCPLLGYWIATVSSPGACNHCLVMRDDEIVWDPAPTQKRSEDNWTAEDQILRVTVIAPLDPAALLPSKSGGDH
jgi:hypothetical protein